MLGSPLVLTPDTTFPGVFMDISLIEQLKDFTFSLIEELKDFTFFVPDMTVFQSGELDSDL